MERDGQSIIAYVGQDRQVCLTNPGKPLYRLEARIIHHGPKKIIYITTIPHDFDKKPLKAPPGYEIQGI